MEIAPANDPAPAVCIEDVSVPPATRTSYWVGDFVLLGQRGQTVDDDLRAEHRRILDFDGRAAAELDRHRLRTDHIARVGHVYRDGVVRRDGVGRRLRAAAADLLLYGEDEVGVVSRLFAGAATSASSAQASRSSNALAA